MPRKTFRCWTSPPPTFAQAIGLGALFWLSGTSAAHAANLSGNLTGTLLLSQSPYVVTANVTVPAGQTLSIEPGVIIKVTPQALFQVDGTLLAVGTSAQSIVFTSLTDDSFGGDTGGDGPTQGHPGDWRDIYFNGAGSSGSRLDHVVVRYGGNSESANIYIDGSSPTITNCDISSSTAFGIRSPSTLGPVLTNNRIHDNVSWGLVVNGQVAAISNNVFDANGGGIYFDYQDGSPTITGNTFRNTLSQVLYINRLNIFLQDGGGNVFETTNQENGIYMAAGIMTKSGVWGFTSLPYILRGGNVTIGGGPGDVNLTIAPGAVIKSSRFNNGATLFQVNNTLTAVGTSSQPITFTSVRDDTVGGDSNAFEGVNSPAPGDWRDIYFNGAGSSGSRLEHVVVRYGGNSENANIFIDASSPTITNCDINSSSLYGIRAPSAPGPVLTNNRIHDNPSWGLVANGQTPVISNNIFDANGGGIYFDYQDGSPVITGNTFRNTLSQVLYINRPNIFLQDGGGNIFEASNKENGIYLFSGTMTKSGIWNFASLPYIMRAGTVFVGTGSGAVNLTIAPGMVIKSSRLDNGATLFQVNDTLTAVGTSSQPITFTSVRDDTVGGDSNAYEGPSSPALGDWRDVYFNGPASSGSRLEHVVVRYGGNSENANIFIDGSSPTITNCDISSSTLYGVRAPSTLGPVLNNNRIHDNPSWGLVANGQTGTISNNLFDANGGGIYFDYQDGTPTITGNTFRNNLTQVLYINRPNIFPQDGGGNVFDASNKENGIYLFSGTMTKSGVWNFKSLPYIMRAGTVFVGTGSGAVNLTIAPGMVIKSSRFNGPALLQVNDTLTAVGTSSEPITFTSLRDDTVGGDSNAFEGVNSPAAGDWRDIYFNGPGSSGSRLDHVVVRYGGTFENADIYISNSSPTITNSLISQSSVYGIRIESGSKPSLQVNTIRLNASYGIETNSGAQPLIHNNNFISNNQLGLLNNDATVVVDAINNYWGDPSGPSGAGPGTGEAVSAHVNFSPFLPAPTAPGTIPVTTVQARILDIFGHPVPSAPVSLIADTAVNGTTDADGNLSQPGISALVGYVRLSATATVQGITMSAQTQRNLDATGVTHFGDVLLTSPSTLSGNISGTLDQAHSPYKVVGDITVLSTETLTLLPGTIVKIGSNLNFTVNGVLASLGISSNPVVITSLSDSSVGGDTLGNNSFGAPGQWGTLRFNNSDFSTQLNDTVLRFGQQISLTSASPHLNHVTISSMSSTAILADVASMPTGIGNQAFGSAANGVDLSAGIITSSITWSNLGIPYLLRSGRVRVDGTGSLTLAAGAIVKSTSLGAFAVTNGGQLFSQGTVANPVLFTSYRDDTAEGDTNNDGNTAPASGDWGGLQFIRSGPGQFQNVVMRWGGFGPRLDVNLNNQFNQNIPPLDVIGSTVNFSGVQVSSGFRVGLQLSNASKITVASSTWSFCGGLFDDTPAVYVAGGSSLALNDVAILNSKGNGLRVDGGSVVSIANSQMNNNQFSGVFVASEAATTITNSELVGNGLYGIDASGNVSSTLAVQGSTFTANTYGVIRLHPAMQTLNFSGNHVSGNKLNSIDRNQGTITTPVIWADYGLPYTMVNGPVRVDGLGTLTLGAGLIIKANASGSLAMTNGGQLFSQGTSSKPVVMTSYRDDTVAGDTNNDGTTTTPVYQSWGGLQFIRSGPGLLQNMIVRWTGYGPHYDINLGVPFQASMNAFDLWGSTLTLAGVQVSSGANAGMDVNYGSHITVTNSLISNNNNGLQSNGSQVSVTSSTIQGNRSFGVINGDPSTTVDATYDYWGSSTGPTYVANPGGSGDKVSDHVQYIPYLNAPAGGSTDQSDVLPPRTHIAPGAPHVGTGPIVVSSATPISLVAEDDRFVIGDGQGLGTQETQVSIDSAAFSLYSAPFFLVSPGTHTLSFFSTDVLNHVETTTSAVVVVDLEPPVTQVQFSTAPYLSASSQTFISGVTQVLFSATDIYAGVNFTQYRVDPATSTPFQTYSSGFVLTGGTHTLEYRSADAVGNLETAKNFAINIDTAPPASRLTVQPPPGSLADGTLLISSQTLFSLAATDAGSAGVVAGLRDIQVSVDSASFTTYVSSFNIAAPGRHTLSWRARDNVGNTEVLQSTTVATSTQTAAPITQIALGTPYYIDASSRIYVSSITFIGFTVDDHGSGLAFTRYRLDGSAFSIYSSSFTLQAGSHTITFQSQDLLGNLEIEQNVTLYTDLSPPTAQIIFAPQALVDGAGQIFISTASSVFLQIQDAQSGVAATRYRVDAASSSTAFTLYQSSFTLSAGIHSLEVVAVDQVGNQKIVPSFTVHVATFAPDTGGSSDPTGTTLPDGTPVVGSPIPVTLPGAPGNGPAPTVASVSLSPASPVGTGAVVFTIVFSKAMDSTVYPDVTFRPSGVSATTALSVSSFVGTTWTGSAAITDTMNSGTAVLQIKGAKDASGNPISDTTSTFEILITLLAPPPAPSASAQSAQVALSWTAVPGAASYNLYRATYSVTSRVGLVPLQTGLHGTSASDAPSADTPQFYYALSAVGSDGLQSRLSSTTVIAMPLPPVITHPASGANVDISSTIIQGVAQPGALVDLSTSAFGTAGQTLVTATATAAGQFSARLTLGHGPFTVNAAARSAVTGLTSSTAAVTINVIDFPIAPANFAAAPGDTTVSLTWTQSAQPDVIGYNLYRDGGVTPLTAAPLPSTQTSYQDLALTDGRTYIYIITSVRTGGQESQPSAAVQATPAAGPGWGQ